MAKHAMMTTSNIAKLALGATIAVTALGATAAVSAETAHRAAKTAAQESAAQESAAQGSAQGRVNVTAAQVLATARAQVGVSEDANGGGTKFQK
ncbi:CHAP domain-containing protein, partial [Nonomuraea sp. NPDC001699]